MQFLTLSSLLLSAATCQALATTRAAFTPAPGSYDIKASYSSEGTHTQSCPPADKFSVTANSDYTAITLKFEDLSIPPENGMACTLMLEFEPKKADAVGLLYSVVDTKYSTTLGPASFASTYTFAYDVKGKVYGYISNPAPVNTDTKVGAGKPEGVTSSIIKPSRRFESPPTGAGSIALQVEAGVWNFFEDPAENATKAELNLIREFEQEITLSWAKAADLVV